MSDTRRKNVAWLIPPPHENVTREQAILATLMDVRDELQRLNCLLHCSNFTQIPGVLRAIRRNTAKPRKPKA